MKRVKKPVFFIVALLILALTYTSIFGVYGQNGDSKITYIKGASDIRWGIDIRGGVEATFSPANDYKATEAELESAKSIIEYRMVSKNITDYEIYTDSSNNRIIVRFPWASDEENFDPESAINEIAERGCSMLNGSGFFTKKDIKVIFCIAKKSESNFIFELINEIDPNAFVAQSAVVGVYGQGFDHVKKHRKLNLNELREKVVKNAE